MKEIIHEIEGEKPAYNTVSTLVRILEKKKFVSHNAFGKTYQYYPIIAEDDYKKLKTNNLVSNFFGGSAESMLSFFVKDKKIDLKEIDEILKKNK